MKRNTAILLSVTIIAVAGFVRAQNPTASPAFEVASIRPALPPTLETVRSGQFHAGARVDGARLDFGYVSLFNLLPYAFGVKPHQISAPSWSRDSMWNILANLPAGTSEEQIPQMMQTLLADRFKMTVHHEKRDQQVYELQVAPGGLKVELSTGGDFKPWDGSFPGFGFNAGIIRGGPRISGRILEQPNCGQRWEFLPLSVSGFADALTMFLGKPVVDETNLKGDYLFTLDINADTMYAMNQNMFRSNPLPAAGGGGGGQRGGRGGGGGGGPATAPGQGPPAPAQGLGQCIQAATEQAAGTDGNIGMLFQAVQKLGLKLQQGRAPIDTVVIDRLEKTPTEN
jgi:uncharacterized protein (TIGR03435 family)